MYKRDLATLALVLVTLASCRARMARYLVVPSAPQYLLQSPDGNTRAFPETTADFSNGIDGWVDLKPGMTLKLERAYFEPPESRRIQDYIGLETVRFQYESQGSFRQSNYAPLRERPRGQPPVTSAIPSVQLLTRHHRLLFEVVLNKESGAARPVLLSNDSHQAIAKYAEGLTRGSGCNEAAASGMYCAAIPQGTTASLSFDVVANGKPLAVLWGTTVAGIVGPKRSVRLSRAFRGRMVPVVLDVRDPNALRLPLLPGDVLRF